MRVRVEENNVRETKVQRTKERTMRKCRTKVTGDATKQAQKKESMRVNVEEVEPREHSIILSSAFWRI